MGFNLETPTKTEIAAMPAELSAAWRAYLLGDLVTACPADDGAMAHLLRACLAWDRGDATAALAHGFAALEAAPRHMALRRNMAALLAASNRRALAEDLLTAAVDEAPLDPESWLSRADFLYRQGDLEAALADLRRALLAEPNHAPALRGQARILRRLGRRREARVIEGKLAGLGARGPAVARTG